MFGKKDNSFPASPTTFDTLVGKNANFTGNLESAGLVRIEGNVAGDIKIEGNLVIGKDSLVEGNIKAANVEIYGSVNGDINVDNSLTIYDGATLTGDVDIRNLVIKENANFKGTCKTKTYKDKNEKVLNAETEETKKHHSKNKSKGTA